MELPDSIKSLFQHWSYHTTPPENSMKVDEIFQNRTLFEEISYFVRERMSIWDKKFQGQLVPYTEDPILEKYRFCNIFRELDRQTIEFHTLLNPIRDDFSLWLLNMFYCRMVARTQTIHNIGLLSFDKDKNEIVYERLMNCPRPRYGTPYVFPISTIMRSSNPTRELFITRYLPTVVKQVAKEISTWHRVSVVDGVNAVLPIFGFNLKFLWTEVLIDVAYQYPDRIDLFKEFPVGPGALPTFEKINQNVPPEHLALHLARIKFNPGLTFYGKSIFLSAENWEGIGCEFRKYGNICDGRGRRRVFSK